MYVTTRQLLVVSLLLVSLAVIFPVGVLSFQVVRRQELFRNDAARSILTSTPKTTTWASASATSTSSAAAGTSLHAAFASVQDGEDSDGPALAHSYEYDLAVIGAGPVGVQAAIVAATTAKKNVILIDAPRASGQLMNEETNEDLSIGGPTGLFSKALRDAAKRIKVPTLRGMGLREDSIWNEITSSCVELASFNARDVKRQLEYAGVTYVEGYAKFSDSGGSHQLIISNDDGKGTTTATTISTDNVLIATGSRPFRPADIPFDGVRVFDSDSINGLSYLPKSLAITGR